MHKRVAKLKKAKQAANHASRQAKRNLSRANLDIEPITREVDLCSDDTNPPVVRYRVHVLFIAYIFTFDVTHPCTQAMGGETAAGQQRYVT